jgi:predicted MFS family arabinose efflux permease
MNTALQIRKVAANGMAARVLLAFLTTAGLYYVNIMPALVDGLKQGLGFTNQQAGLVGSLNVYGAACGAFVIAFFVRRLNWKWAAQLLLLGLIGMDLLSMLLGDPLALAGVRFVHGTIGGMLVGVGFSIIARTRAPDRTFGMLLLVQAGAGGLGVMSLPLLVPILGPRVLFAALIGFSALTLVMLQFLPDFPVLADAPRAPGAAGAERGRLRTRMLLLALLSVFLFQAANMGLYAFIIGLGRNAGLEMTFISPTLGISNWFGMLGALLVVVLSTRFGILTPIVGGMILTIVGTAALAYSEVKWVWIVSNVGVAITWNFVIAYLLGMCARFDRTGQAAVWGGFASKMGLASGPLLASFILGEDHYLVLIAMAVALLVVGTVASASPASRLDRGTV